MAKFAYNNTKNTSTNYILFELNYIYHPWMSYKENIDLCSKSKFADKLANKPQELILV